MNPFLILVVILSIAGLIAIIAYAIHKIFSLKLKEEKPSEEQVVQENLDRYLQPVEDEETAKQISEYKDEEE